MNSRSRRPGLVSVCMPVFNRETTVAACVASILDQSYGDLELIVVDDASTDRSVEVVRSIRDSRIKLVEQPTNQGVVAARRLANDLAVGEFVAIMDSDDIAVTHRLKLQVEALREGLDFCGGWASFFSETPSNRTRLWRTPRSRDEAATELLRGSPIANPTIMFTADYLQRIDDFYLARQVPAADYGLWERLLPDPNLRFENLQLPLVHYRHHDDQMTKPASVRNRHAATSVRMQVLARFGLDRSDPGVKSHLAYYATPGHLREPLPEHEIEHVRALYKKMILTAHENEIGFDAAVLRRHLSRWLSMMAGADQSFASLPALSEIADSVPRFSIIVPAYNVERFLGECLDSVLEQTCSDYEVIIVDDGSTDGSAEVAQEYVQHPQFTMLSKPNGGLSSARNAGVAVARGDYVLFLDSDDYLDPTLLERLSECEPGIEVLVWGHIAFDEYSDAASPQFTPEPQILRKGIFGAFVARRFGYTATIRAYDRGLALITPFEPILHEDELFGIEVFAQARSVQVIDHFGHFYRQRAGSITAESRRANVEGMLHVLERSESVFERFDLRRWSPQACDELQRYFTRASLRHAQQLRSLDRDLVLSLLGPVSRRLRWRESM